MAEVDEEFAAFQAELSKLEDAPKAQTAGPRAPKIISAAPTGPQRESQAASSVASTSSAGLTRAPASQPTKPEQTASSTQRETNGTASERASSTNAAEATNASARVPPTSSYPEGTDGGIPQAFTPAQPSSSSSAPAARPHPPEVPRPHQTKAAGKEPKGKEKEPTVTKRFCAGSAWEDKTLADWPEDDFRIFVGDLGNETNDDVLGHAFAKYPSFQKARVVRNKQTQKSQGYGFVSFKDPWDMTKAVRSPSPDSAQGSAGASCAPVLQPALRHCRSMPPVRLQALREMHGKYIGNRPVKVRKSTWKERGLQESEKDWKYALAVSDKKDVKKFKSNPTLKKGPHVSKKQKGMPW